MRRYHSLWFTCAAAAVWAVPAWGQTFNYFEDFNSVAAGAKPPGWSTQNSTGNAALDPVVLSADPGGWATPVDYNIAWSGGKRFNFIHPAQDAGGRAAVAWYSGAGGPHTGTYPLALQTNKLKAVFDLSIRKGTSADPADGGVFAVQPVIDAADLASAITRVGAGGGGMAWAGLTGFAIEFDIYSNGATNDPDGADIANHIGLDVFLKWAGGDQLPSLKTNVDLIGAGVMPRFVAVGDNNQPIHITVYYNDPDQGGMGVVRVYLKVDPDTYSGSGTAISYGMDAPTVDGVLVLEACVGAWPTAGAIFGYTGSTGGANSVYQIDNLMVRTDAASGTACEPTGLPAFNPGADVNVDAGGAVVSPSPADLTEPGWRVATYPTYSDNLDGAKSSLGLNAAFNILAYGSATGEPDLNYNNSGCDGNVAGGRAFPGLCGNDDYYAVVATGWIYFAPDDGSKPYPRSYPLNLTSDDGYEIIMGTGVTNQLIKDFTGGRGCASDADAGSIFNLIVPAAGIYPIQILQFEMGGGAGMEFYRRSETNSLLLRPPATLIGTKDGGQTDQPKIFGLYKGQPAPNLMATYPTASLPSVAATISPSQKISGTTSGQQAFNMKFVKCRIPNIGIGNAYEDDYRAVALGFLETLDNLVPGFTSTTVNFRENGQNETILPCGSVFPNQGNAVEDNFAVRAEGFATFPVAGMYYLGLDVDDDGYIRIGNQTIYNTPCCPNNIIPVNVVEAGTYPIRVEFVEYGGDARFKFYQVTPNGGRVPVNSPGSTIKVFTSATSGAFAWKPSWQGWTLPADRKVANVGQGGTLGWDAVAAKVPAGVNVSADSGHMGIATALVENNLAALPGLTVPQATATPPYINYQTGGEFTAGSTIAGQNIADLPLSDFLLSGGAQLFTTGGDAEDNFAMGFSGYIEFAQAGNYAFNCNSDDGSAVWIGGQVVTEYPLNSGAGDNTPGFLKIVEPGIYDIRVDFFEGGGANEIEIVQYLPSGTRRVLINDPTNAGTVKVYRTLAVAPATTLYRKPGFLPSSAKIGEWDRAGESGARVQVVNAKFVTGNGDGGIGQDKLRTSQENHELLAAVIDGVPSFNQYGTLASDTVKPTITFGDTGAFTGAQEDDFGVRVTGVLALTPGGHIFEIASDDGYVMTMAGKVVGQSGSLKGTYPVSFYVNAETQGLYPFTIEYNERGGGNTLTFNELVVSLDTNNGNLVVTREAVNTGNAVKMYVGLNPCAIPFADADRDGDVDQDDFAAFQLCFSGSDIAASTSAACQCFNRDKGLGDGDVDATDLVEFTKCITGPTIPGPSVAWPWPGLTGCNP